MDQKAGPPKFVKDEDYRKYYANSARIVRTPWDVSIIFGQSDTHSLTLEGGGGGEGLTINDGTEIVMSYQHAVSLFNLLKDHVGKITGTSERKEETSH